MGEVIRGKFVEVIESTPAEAKRRGISAATVWHERRYKDLPPKSLSTNGRLYPSRQLTYEQRRKRDKRIRLALECGFTVRWIRENLHVSGSVVYAVSRKTPNRRKVHTLSRRHWANRGDLCKD